MLGGAKPLASLSSTLLARKGQARPAMRRQATLASLSQAGDDLGWNDMGEPLPSPVPPPVLPPVLEERAQLEEAIAPEPVAAPAPAPVPAAVVAAVAASVPHGRKAAFTLRLDSERHLRLRLASAARGRSAQQLVTDALDALIATMPEVEALRGQLPTGA